MAIELAKGSLPIPQDNGPPIKLKDVNIAGFAAEAARPGQQVRVWTYLSLTSDQPAFHRIVQSMAGVIAKLALDQAGVHLNIGLANSVLMVVRRDSSADLWVDTAAIMAKAVTKRSIQAGQLVFDRDIADLIEVVFPNAQIGPSDRVLYLFREDWRFGLFFDLRPSEIERSIGDLGRHFGTLHRRLRYHHLANQKVFGALVEAGWFPFVEIVGNEFMELALACEAGFPLEDHEAKLARAFDAPRLEHLLQRWLSKPHFKPKEAILRSAISNYLAGDPVAVIKTVLSEIEGVLREAYRLAGGSSAWRTETILKWAREQAEQKAGAPDTLLFTAAFADYLEAYTFADFDPTGPLGDAGSRHAVGHGAAVAESYTQTRSLQALLTLDQLAFYI